MKKVKLMVLAALLGSSVMLFHGNVAKAAEENPLPSGYYFIKPTLDKSLQVNPSFKLDLDPTMFNRFEFYYFSPKKAYLISEIPAYRSVAWNGKRGLKNLEWKPQNVDDEKMLWTLKKESGNKYVIHNKKDPTMVWSVHNYYPVLGTPIKLEKVYSVGESQFNAQVFTLGE